MSISDELARLNRDRFREFRADREPEAQRPAALAFAGDTYVGLDARSLSDEDMALLEEELRSPCIEEIAVFQAFAKTVARGADQIIVLDRGGVVECGRHGDLVHDDTWYSEMVKIQAAS